MTTPFERTRALVFAGDFLEELRVAGPDTDLQKLKDQANHILRHYPSTMEIGQMADDAVRANPIPVFSPKLDPEAVPKELRKGYRR